MDVNQNQKLDTKSTKKGTKNTKEIR